MNESYMLHELKEGPLQICIFRNFIIESLFNNIYRDLLLCVIKYKNVKSYFMKLIHNFENVYL
ncbi:hypothetical protein PFBG_01266 [Plasmodium falciparum 7G8]|uniref:Uncharacterized protein n=3 Tax=Plasmodium falciparum TaxID=5833 RepID=A0A024XBA5_PLAFC|nr:hypothetical protein PFNF135_01369 [Plasmodium falciparum NF135/5.C10]ETW62764.1 hypothetical protein PFMC_01285 [Plasmodium falciparum CAMP/Malaysia]EUR75523.1 hypothetical protein PFBG_01266 [Plasmodium falciparum 7G8]